MTRLLALLLLLAPPAAAVRAQPPQAEAFFEAKIRPVLATVCARCHGQARASGGLRVDSRAALLKGGEHGPALAPGVPAKSLLLQALRHTHPDLRMPPDKKLPDHVVADFAAWICDGAAWPRAVAGLGPLAAEKHWAFQ